VKLVRQLSVSAKGDRITRCARLVEDMMRDAGISTKILGARGELYGEVKSKTSRRTLLFYNNYDVQPPELIEKWGLRPPSAAKLWMGKSMKGASRIIRGICF